jgi:hypothetical protein
MKSLLSLMLVMEELEELIRMMMVLLKSILIQIQLVLYKKLLK